MVDRTGENKSVHECEAPLPTPARRVCLWCIFLALPVKNGPLPAEQKFRENTVWRFQIFVSALEASNAALQEDKITTLKKGKH